jgi:hypothetical protein
MITARRTRGVHVGFSPITSVSNGDNLYRGGIDGVSMPNCTYTPNPGYSEEAHKFQVNGKITTEAVVIAEGRLENVRIVRGLPGGLDGLRLARRAPASQLA